MGLKGVCKATEKRRHLELRIDAARVSNTTGTTVMEPFVHVSSERTRRLSTSTEGGGGGRRRGIVGEDRLEERSEGGERGLIKARLEVSVVGGERNGRGARHEANGAAGCGSRNRREELNKEAVEVLRATRRTSPARKAKMG